jgi:hypothetical protein
MKIIVFWDVVLCSLTQTYPLSDVLTVFINQVRRPDDGNSKHLWNVCQSLRYCTTQHPRRQSTRVRCYFADWPLTFMFICCGYKSGHPTPCDPNYISSHRYHWPYWRLLQTELSALWRSIYIVCLFNTKNVFYEEVGIHCRHCKLDQYCPLSSNTHNAMRSVGAWS